MQRNNVKTTNEESNAARLDSGATICYNADRFTFNERIKILLDIERAENEYKIHWMSFVDTDKPKDRFLGVIITKQLGLAHAIQNTHKLGINPGGQVASYELEEIENYDNISNKLLSREELEKLQLI